ncbi:MAG: hypothetical protein WBK04_00045, partial [Bacillota bacterium]
KRLTLDAYLSVKEKRILRLIVEMIPTSIVLLTRLLIEKAMNKAIPRGERDIEEGVYRGEFGT